METTTQQESSSTPQPPTRRLAGPDIRVRAVGAGVVMTRREQDEDLQNRKDFGVGKY